jgi:hypothetical protein
MNYFRQYSELHHSAQRAVVPYTWREYSSWRFIAEISRRWPGKFTIIEGPGHEGLGDTSVWFLVEQTSSGVPGTAAFYVNNLGSITLANHDETHDCEMVDRENPEDYFTIANLDVLFSIDLERLLLDIESCVVGWSPAETPLTRSDTVGQRVIAECLGLMLHTNNPLRVSGYLFDGVRYQEYLAEKIPSLAQVATITGQKEEWSQLFFVQESVDNGIEKTEPGRILFAVDCARGTLFVGNSRINLIQEYSNNGRSIQKLCFELLKLANPN